MPQQHALSAGGQGTPAAPHVNPNANVPGKREQSAWVVLAQPVTVQQAPKRKTWQLNPTQDEPTPPKPPPCISQSH